MGALDEGHYDVVLENGVKFEKDGDEIEVAVKVLLEMRGYLSFFYMFLWLCFLSFEDIM